MTKANRLRKLQEHFRGIKATDARTRFQEEAKEKREKEKEKEGAHLAPLVEERLSAERFLEYNPNLGPPYHVLVDTSFLNFTVRLRIDLINGMIDCLVAKATPYVTDCVIQELERHGRRFSVALRLTKDPRVRRLRCDHENIGYADDCLYERARASQCYIVATNDVELKQRLRRLPGVPILTALRGRYAVERLADAELV